MEKCKSCVRCGRCCTQFGVCLTPSDVKRISSATGMAPIEFIDLIPDYADREREEPAILIGQELYILVLKRNPDNVCFFYNGSGCRIYGNRPSLCRSFPFRVSSFEFAVLDEMKSRSCAEPWDPDEKAKQQYLGDCIQYKKEVEEYREAAERWNKSGGGTLDEFLNFISDQ
jgi:Fe-S-cluster containining protein